MLNNTSLLKESVANKTVRRGVAAVSEHTNYSYFYSEIKTNKFRLNGSNSVAEIIQIYILLEGKIDLIKRIFLGFFVVQYYIYYWSTVDDSVVLVSGVQQSESVILYLLFLDYFPMQLITEY